MKYRAHAPLAACLAVASLSLWIRHSLPMTAFGDASIDDALFVRGAHYLLLHRWLGPYDDLTLAKGMFFPFFIACMSAIGMSVHMGEQLLYLAGAAGAGIFMRQSTGRPWLAVLLFTVLAFDPLLFGPNLARVSREGLYIGLTLAVVVLQASLMLKDQTLRMRLVLAIVLGLVLGAFWLTREEGVWIMPSLVTLAAFGLAHNRMECPRPIVEKVGCLVVAAGIAVGCNLVVASINDRVYGVFETVEFKASSFVRAYSALASIDPDNAQTKVVIPAAARRMAYAASPTARKLQPYLDGQLGDDWRLMSCRMSDVPADRCPEILAGWFMWALRDSVAASGHAESAPQTNAFYNRMADELEAACADGHLVCAIRRPTLAPPFRWRYVRDAIGPGLHLVKLAVTLDPIVIVNLPNTGSQQQLQLFSGVFDRAEVERNTAEHQMKMNHQGRHYLILAFVWLYARLIPVLSVFAIAGLAASTLFRGIVPFASYALTLASFIGVACRICLLAYLDATSIPASNEIYLSAVTPLVLIFAVMGTALFVQVLSRYARARTHAGSAPVS